jgi:hypothetical protein
MSVLVTITSFTANTPMDVYYCDSEGDNCVYVASTSNYPYQFNVPSPYSDNTFIVKIIDSQSCEVLKTIPYNPIPL